MAGIEDDNSKAASRALNDFEDSDDNGGKMEMKKSPSVPVGVRRGTNRRQFSLNLGVGEEEEEDFIATSYKRQLQVCIFQDILFLRG